MKYGLLIAQLKQLNVIKNDLTLNNRFQTILNKHPDYQMEIVEQTSFLQYSAPIKVRLHCILQRIVEQPVCGYCGEILKMRTDGKYRNTFPEYCGSKCFRYDDTIKQKRALTNIKRYGHSNVLQRHKMKKF